MKALRQRTLTSSFYSFSTQSVLLIASLIRSVILARLLAPEDFGVYVFVASIVTIILLIPNSWLSGPFLHRSKYSAGEDGARIHFTLNLAYNSVWLLLALIVSFIVLQPSQWTIFAVLLISGFFRELTNTHRLILVKRVLFKRIALVELAVTISTTISAVILAYLGFGVWSLVSINIVTALISIMLYVVIRPVWRWRLSWQKGSILYFFHFGKKTFVAGMLNVLLGRVDDLWTGYFLGASALGYYSRAYQFATYPRKMLAQPLNAVAAGTYAELKGDREKLSKAFRKFNSVIIRLGFAISGLLITIAPEFIMLLLGEKWLPMLETFRIMLIFSMFDPMMVTVASVLVAVGKPNHVGQARAIQMIVLIIGLLALAPALDIIGVALAVDIMLFVGIAVMLFFASRFVDFSLRRLFLVPLVGLLFGVGLALWIPTLENLVLALVTKTVVFSIVYVVILVLFDRNQLMDLIDPLKEIVIRRAVK